MLSPITIPFGLIRINKVSGNLEGPNVKPNSCHISEFVTQPHIYFRELKAHHSSPRRTKHTQSLSGSATKWSDRVGSAPIDQPDPTSSSSLSPPLLSCLRFVGGDVLPHRQLFAGARSTEKEVETSMAMTISTTMEKTISTTIGGRVEGGWVVWCSPGLCDLQLKAGLEI